MKRISSGSSFEDRVGYARAVVSNGHVFVSATAATGEEGQILHLGDYYGQTKAILEKLEKLLAEVGSSIRGQKKAALQRHPPISRPP